MSPADIVSLSVGVDAWVGGKFSAFETKRFDTAVNLCTQEPHDCSMIHTYYPKLVPVATPELIGPPEPVK